MFNLSSSNETKRQDMMKPYDSKKSVWISDDEGGFVEGLLQSDDGKKAVVMVGHEVSESVRMSAGSGSLPDSF